MAEEQRANLGDDAATPAKGLRGRFERIKTLWRSLANWSGRTE
jgi:hypothetical protein